MRILVELGFIKSKPKGDEEVGYIVILSPYYVVKKLRKKRKVKNEGLYNALLERCEQIKATDLENDEEIKEDNI